MTSILNEVFEKVFFINLDKRTDRLQSITSQLEKVGIEATRFKAINGDPNGYHKGLLREEVGCAFSHLAILQMAKENGWKSVLIMEDDADINPDIDFLFSEYTRELTKNWQVLMFSGNHNYRDKDLLTSPISKHIFRCYSTLTTTAYGVKQEVYDTLINRIEIIDKSLDLMYIDLQPSLEWYCLRPGLIKQKAGYSDIVKKEVDYSDCII